MGCSFDATVEGKPTITCQSPGECPPDFFCQARINRCVRLLSPGLRPPELAGPAVVSPTLVRRSAALRVFFGVNEPLEQPPSCRAVFSNGSAVELQPLDLGLGALSYAYELTPPDDAPEGSVRLSADLLDQDGALAEDLELGAAVLDFTPPALVRGAAALTLLPSATNLLSRVEAMNETTLAQVTFAVTEPLHAAPVLTASAGGDASAVVVRYAGATGTSHVFALTLASAQVPQGPVALRVALEDLAGNQAEVPVELAAPGLVIDTQAPTIEGLGDGGVLLRRAPTGAAFRFGTRGTTITSGPGSTEAAATVIASEAPTSPDLARTIASNDGAFELTLPADLPSVTVRALDAAGNQSRPALVRQSSWFASFVGSAPGAANPHRAWSTRVLGAAVEPFGAVELYGTSGLHDVGGGAALVNGGINWQRRWTAAPTSGNAVSPSTPRVVATWDPFRARVIAVDPFGSPINVYEWNGLGWQLVTPSDPEGDGQPSGGTQLMSTGSIAFDEDERVTLVISAGGPSGARGTWAWNGASWRLLAQDTGTRCTNCSLAWDSKRRRVLLFDPPTGTTAAWSWATRSWQFLALATAPTLTATGPAMAFERHTGRWLRFGGQPIHDETWAFEGTTWTRLTDGGPTPRWGALLGYDPVTQQVLLHGGSQTTTRSLGDTWRWDGQGWEQVGDGGPNRYTGTLLFAPPFDQALLVGGGETYVRAPDGGFIVAALSMPLEARSGVASTYSPFHDALYLVGGINDAGAIRTSVQALTDRGFRTLAALPEARTEGGLGVDPASGRFFYVGGRIGDGGLTSTSFFSNDAGTGWVSFTGSVPTPDGGTSPGPQRTDPIVFFEPGQGALVMAGGRDSVRATNSVYTYRPGGAWVDGGLSLPIQVDPCFAGGTAATSATGETLVQLGFSTTSPSFCPNTTTINSIGRFMTVAGNRLESVLLPSLALAQGALAWDETISAWIAFGGRLAPSSVPDGAARVLHANQWIPYPMADIDGDGSPGPRFRPAMGFLKSRRRLVLAGGETTGRPLDDAWELELAGQRPAVLVRIGLQDALPRGATPVALSFEGLAGADDGDGGRPGVSAHVWHRQRWRELGAAMTPDGGPHVAGTQRPEAFLFELRDPRLLADLLEEPAVTFALVPSTGLVMLPPRLVVDYVEARLDATFAGSGP